MPHIIYGYPMQQTVSFTLVAREYVRILRRYFRVSEIDVHNIAYLNPVTNPDLFIHPFFYPIDSRPYIWRILFEWKRRDYHRIIGVDVADSNRISESAVAKLNETDGVIVNSEWSRRAFVDSGVKVPVYVVPHKLSDPFYRDKVTITNPVIAELHRYKKEKPHIRFVLFFLWHSGYRKGADLAYQMVKRLVDKGRKVILLVKIHSILDPLLGQLTSLPSVLVKGWLSDNDLVALFDVADAVLVPSRGGSFELNGAEALARGRPIIAAQGSVIEEHMPDVAKPYMLVRPARWVKVLPGNPIHVGEGPELDVDEGAEKLDYLLYNRESLEDVLAKTKAYVRQKYSPKRVEDLLVSTVKKIVGEEEWLYRRTTTRLRHVVRKYIGV